MHGTSEGVSLGEKVHVNPNKNDFVRNVNNILNNFWNFKRSCFVKFRQTQLLETRGSRW